MFGYLFLSALAPQPNISTLSTLVFLLLQKFEFTLLSSSVASLEWTRDFNPSSYLQPWIGSVHQSYTAGASLGEELIGISSLGAGDFILCCLIAIKICHVPSYGWAIVLLKLLGYWSFWSYPGWTTVAQPWFDLLRFIKSSWPRNNYVISNWQEVSNGFFTKRCICCPIS